MQGVDALKRPDISNAYDSGSYQQTGIQKDLIIQRLKQSGCRITRQRLMLLDIILEDECSCCKEIYYKALRLDEKIGKATVYRMVNTLEEIGAISRKNMYKVVCGGDCAQEDVCTVEFDDGTIERLSAQKWYQVICSGLRECGYMQGRQLRSVKAKTCTCCEDELLP